MKVMLLKYLRRYSIPIGILILSVLGARLENTLFTYLMLALICIAIVGVSLGKVDKKYYSAYVFSIGLSLLFQSTLISNGLIGTDIHTEYYFYYEALDGWNMSIPHAYNSAIGTTVVAPFLTNYLHIPGYWIYKAVFPALFALVPVLLYYIFRKQFGSQVAFLSCIFFVIVPTWSLEMIGLPRQMLGEVMFASCLFLILVSNWSLKITIPILVLSSLLGAMFHYVMGPTILLYLGLGSLILLFFKRRVFRVKYLVLVTGILLVGMVGYYSLIAQGTVLSSLVGASLSQLQRLERLLPTMPAPNVSTSGTMPAPNISIPAPNVIIPPISSPNKDFLMGQEPMVRTALGLDFMEVSPWGKVFRILQYMTQLFLVIGCVYLLKNRRKYSAEFLSLCLVSVILIAACILVPKFSSMINVTRFYHLSLFLLAPAFVLGGLQIFRKPILLTICLIIPYFFLTSGAIFELTKQPDIETIEIPYSISLSYQRLSITGIPTENDMEVRDWAVEHLNHAYADINGNLLFTEKMPNPRMRWRYFYDALDTGEFIEEAYIFLSERNTESQTLTFKPVTRQSASGLRREYSWEELGLDRVVEEGTVIYRKGDAQIVRYNS